jgi:quinol monooxygenase YgiN
MIVLHVTLRLTPEQIDEIAARVTDVAIPTRAEEGCIEYIFSRDLIEPDLLHVTECWESEEALERHKTTAHFHAFMAKMPPPLSFERRSFEARPVVLGAKPAAA